MAKLTDYPLEVLEKAVEEKKKMDMIENRPTIGKNLDFSALFNLAEQTLDDLEIIGFADEDTENWFYETAMECIYGTEIWDYINKLDR